jgi:WD40 repeat protein
LSPNGYRFISASTKGTVLRLFSSLNGELMSSFLINKTLAAVIDINFIADGSAIVSLDELNNIRLFNARMSEEEKICEIARSGLDIYEHDNPTSWLSFLGFLDE